MDTIFAVSSGSPPAAISVIRISGPAAIAAAMQLAGSLPPPRVAGLRTLRDRDGATLDQGLVLVFPGPGTATGEDLVELHCHGGRAVVAAVEDALAAKASLRHAVPGEFTRRAMENGRLDLAQAHGLADLLEAETEDQRRAAIGAMEGRVSRLVQGWLDRILLLAAQIEAQIEFSDEDDIGEDPEAVATVADQAATLGAEMRKVLAVPPVERLKDGVRVVLAGPPNVGKSTLLNLLVQRDAAIVSPLAGTTRDRIEVPVQRSGRAYLLIDTAGLTTTEDPVEAEGVVRTRVAIRQGDVLLWLGDETPVGAEWIWLQPRADLRERTALLPGRHLLVRRDDPDTVDELWRHIERQASALLPSTQDILLHRTERDHVEAAAATLGRPERDILLLAEQLRAAQGELAAMIGNSGPEAVLATLFGRFCIGK